MELSFYSVKVPDVSTWTVIIHLPSPEGGFYYLNERTTGSRISALSYNLLYDGSVLIKRMRTAEKYRRQGMSLVLLDRLYCDNPDAVIHPGRMTTDGNALYEFLVGNEPIAKNVGGKAWLA